MINRVVAQAMNNAIDPREHMDHINFDSLGSQLLSGDDMEKIWLYISREVNGCRVLCTHKNLTTSCGTLELLYFLIFRDGKIVTKLNCLPKFLLCSLKSQRLSSQIKILCCKIIGLTAC